MSRTLAKALVLVNWKGVFYERYVIDRHVTALEGANGAGKTTVMIGAYLVLLPDMSRLRFTNLGETGATGGDKGIWGRLGEAGRPAYSVIDFGIADDQRLVAGVHLERKGEPSVEPTPFIISGLEADVRLQDVLLLSQGDREVVPELSELKENVARLGGRMQIPGSVREYFGALFEHGVMPLRLGTDEERNKLNEMLRTSMTGGISRALTTELRSFLLKEESGLADTLQRMKANLDACRRTRIEVQDSQRLEREIGGVFEAGQTMFAAAFLATRERADEHRRRVTEAEEAYLKAQHRSKEAEENLVKVQEELARKGSRQKALDQEIKTAEDWLRRLQMALEASQEVALRREKLSSAEAETKIAADNRASCERVRSKCRATVSKCHGDHKRASSGLADFQRGLEELHHRASDYRQVVKRKSEAERLLEVDEVSVASIADRITQSRAELERVDRIRREAKQRIADAEEHRREHAVAIEALAMLVDAPIEPGEAYAVALEQLRRFRDIQALASRMSIIADEFAKARKLADLQAEAIAQIEKIGLPLSGQRPARQDIKEHLERVEQEVDQHLQHKRQAQQDASDCQRTLVALRARQKELSNLEPIWRDLKARATNIADKLDLSVTSLPELRAAREVIAQRLIEAGAYEQKLVDRRESLHEEAQELLAAGGPFDAELLRVKDMLGADLLASAFEEISIKEAGLVEARLGPLVQALVVDDPAEVASNLQERPESLPELWLVGRYEDATKIAGDGVSQCHGTKDVVVVEQHSIRVTRVPQRPRLGRYAREKRAAELRVSADNLDAQIESARSVRRGLEQLKEDGETLLAEQTVWLAGDPAPELIAIQRELVELDNQEKIHRAEAARHSEAARELQQRRVLLQNLLGMSAYLDPPDHAIRRDELATEHESAVLAQTEIRRCGDAARIVEGKLDVLRRLPLTEAEVATLESEQMGLEEKRGKLDDAIDAMEYISGHAEALNWDDAPAQLDKKKSLVPALTEQLRRAEEALEKAENAAKSSEEDFERATAEWQDADGRRRAAVEQLRASEDRFTKLNVADPTEAAVKKVQRDMQQRQSEANELSRALDELKTIKGRREAEQAQAESECKEAKEKVITERRVAEPAIDRWERLLNALEEQNLLSTVLSHGNRDESGIRGSVNLMQEAHKQRAVLVERLRTAHSAKDLLAKVDKEKQGADSDLRFADVYLEHWLAVRDWLRRRLPAQVAEVDDPREALLRLRDQLTGLEERLARQEKDLRGASEDVARGIEVQIRKARGQVTRLNKNLDGVSFGSIERIRVKLQSVDRMEQVLRALREGAVQRLLFQENIPIEEALDEIFRRYAGGRTGGQRLLDYREYVHLQVEVRRNAGLDWETANPTRLSTGEAIGVGAALMMVVLTEWERDANLLRGKRTHGALRFLFLDEANRLSHDNLGVLFELCQTLDLQLLIAAPEVARAEGNTTYRLVRRIDANGREEVVVSGRRTRVEA